MGISHGHTGRGECLGGEGGSPPHAAPRGAEPLSTGPQGKHLSHPGQGGSNRVPSIPRSVSTLPLFCPSVGYPGLQSHGEPQVVCSVGPSPNSANFCILMEKLPRHVSPVGRSGTGAGAVRAHGQPGDLRYACRALASVGPWHRTPDSRGQAPRHRETEGWAQAATRRGVESLSLPTADLGMA